MISFPAPPSPDTPAFGLGFPPLMLMPMELFPAPPAFEPELPLVVLTGFPEPPPVPVPFPSGEIATCAARLPLGTSMVGDGGAGMEDSAMIVVAGPLVGPAGTAATSGADATSPVCVRSATRGAAPALISRCGLAGPSVTCAMLTSAGCVSRLVTSGAGVIVVATFFTCLGWSFARVCSLISRCGRAGAAGVASCTIFGRAGRNLGASLGGGVFAQDWRGCVG